MNIRRRRYLLLTILTVIASPAPAGGSEPIGVVKTSQGAVTIERAGQSLPAPVGTTLQVGDQVRAGAASSVGVTLRDDTRLTAGANSRLLISDFKFDLETHEGSMLISLLKGTFSVVTGLVAKRSPQSVEFKTPTMTLGIRGTEFVVAVDGAAE
jgi:hypothetical protein